MQEVDATTEEGRNFQDWISDFDMKIHQLIFHFQNEFKVVGRPGLLRFLIVDLGRITTHCSRC